RVSLVDAVRRGAIDEAARVATAAAELPLSPREELLADVARAVAAPEQVGAGELARVREELTTDALASTWGKTVAKPLVAAFWRAAAGKGDAPFARGSSAPSIDAAAEAEAEAEAEALAACALVAKSSASSA